jgi:twinkle protein
MSDREEDSSVFLQHEECPSCGSSDNLGRWSDGHAYCFGCEYTEPPTEGYESDTPRQPTGDFRPIHYEISAIRKRGLSEETCRRWGYGIADFNDVPCHVANIRDPKTREIIAQKLRFAGKDFKILGTKHLPLYGQWLWKGGDKRSIVITEGELDAMSVSQANDHKYPVVSLPNGAKSAKKSIQENYEFLSQFEKIVLMFDGDEPGQKAAEDVAMILPPGRVFIADLGTFKDANEALVAGEPGAITKAFWNAEPFEPDGIYTLDDIIDDVLKPVEVGRPWFLDSLTRWTYGRRPGEIYVFGAGTGIGKTDFFTQQIAYDALDLGIMTAVIYLEQPPSETGKRIAGKVAGKSFHVPSSELPEAAQWTQGELEQTLRTLKSKGTLIFGGNFAAATWDQIKARIRFLAVAKGVKHFYIDHLTALADPSNERESLETIMKDLALLAQELQIIVHVISHLSTPDGKPHEEGGRVMLRHFKGSRAIGFWSHFAFGLERNPQADDPDEKQRTTFRCLKDRYTGRATGNTMCLAYDQDTGLISESEFTDAEEGAEGLDV